MATCPGIAGDRHPAARGGLCPAFRGPVHVSWPEFRPVGNLFAFCSSFSVGNGGGIGHRSRVPHLGGVKQRKPGSHGKYGSADPGSGLAAVGSDTVMGTAERREAPEEGAAVQVMTRADTDAPDRGTPGDGRTAAGTTGRPIPSRDGAGRSGPASGARGEQPRERSGDAARTDTRRPVTEPVAQQVTEDREAYRPLWVEEPARRRRLPDPVRTAAVRAVLVIAVTLIQAMIAFLCTLAGSWLAFPMVISSVVSTILATWGVLDVWVTRQVWNQRHGVVSTPRSTARTLRRERRRARREARAAERTQARTRRRGGAGQLSHP